MLFTLFCCIRLRDSRLGRAWVAIREDEIAAAAMGVPLMRTKTWAYAIGAFFGGLAGCFYAIEKNSTFPGDFTLNISIFVLCMVILGGMGNVWGVMLGAVVLTYLNYQGLAAVGRELNINISTYSYGIFGAHHRGHDAAPARGSDPQPAAESRVPSRGRGRSTSGRRWPNMSDNLLEARKVRKEFGGLVACNDVDFTVPRGSIVSLIGPNGAGKTTFFNMLTGAYTPTSGEVLFDGKEVAGLPAHTITQLGIGRTFQNIRLFQTMSSLENVMVGMYSRTRGGIVGSIAAHARACAGRSASRPTRRARSSATAGCPTSWTRSTR